METELVDNYLQAQERAIELLKLNVTHIDIYKKRYEPKWEIVYRFPNQTILDIIEKEAN